METMSNAETYFQKYIKDMTDFVEGKVRREVKPTGDIYDTLANILAKELPYGSGVDNAHAFLTNAVMSAAWCGWFTKARSVSDPNNFNPEYIQKFKEAIDKAYEAGKNYAMDRK